MVFGISEWMVCLDASNSFVSYLNSPQNAPGVLGVFYGLARRRHISAMNVLAFASSCFL